MEYKDYVTLDRFIVEWALEAFNVLADEVSEIEYLVEAAKALTREPSVVTLLERSQDKIERAFDEMPYDAIISLESQLLYKNKGENLSS
ncbi:hypothetical protein ACM67B_10000 [Neisseria sp. CCUG17229]|uniref:hypothetical protein n=1 Tax=Neisseria sp. CCUG17229 TaxID=3392036 RepID=UPI003A10095E